MLADFSGPDARDFLQRLSTVDVRALQPGQGRFCFFLQASGKIRSAFWLWCLSPEAFALELPPDTPGLGWEALRSTVEQLTFSERQTLTRVEGLQCAWVISEDTATLPLEPERTEAMESEVRVFAHSSRVLGRALFSLWGRPARLSQELERRFPTSTPLDHQELEELRITAGFAGFGTEITPESNPLEIGLGHAIADQKGCYPGQEVIEKIISLGEPAYRLVRVCANQSLTPGPLTQASKPELPVGTLTSACARQGLARVRKLFARPGLTLMRDQIAVVVSET
jgi:folate-binding protein YgfZ